MPRDTASLLLAYAMPSMKDEIAITWHIEDIRMCLENLDRTDKLTDKECREILKAVEHNHDATIGVNWDVIEYQIDAFLRDRKTKV